MKQMNDHPQPKHLIGKEFVKNDPRINRLGRPKHFDQFRKLAQRIAAEKVIDAAGNSLTRIEQILRSWSRSKQPALQLAFVAYGYGKPPEKLELDRLEPRTRLILHYAHEAPDYQPGPIRHTFCRDSDGVTRLAPPSDDGEGTRRPLLPGAE
jgi:hypothetical protein